MEEFDKRYANKVQFIFSAYIVLVMYIDTMLVPSLPSIAAQFHVNAAEVSLVLAVYLVSGVAFNPIVGKLGDIYGKKRVLKYILPIYTAAVTVTGFSPNFTFLLISRAIQGIGLTILPLALSLVREEFPRELIPKAQGLLSAMFGVGTAVGLPLGAFVSDRYGWQTTYHTAVPFVALFTVLIFLFVKESKFTRPNVKIDYFGAFSLAGALGALVFALSEGSAFGWSSAIIMSLLAACIIFFAMAYVLEKRAHEPILDFRLMRQRNVIGPNITALIVGFGFFMAFQTYAYELESKFPLGYGLSIFQAGLSLVPFAIMNLISAVAAGKFLYRHGTKPYMLAGALTVIIGFLISANSANFAEFIIGTAVTGAGLAALNVAMINVLILSIDKKDMGLATSTNTVFRMLGSSLGAPIAGLLIIEFASRSAFAYSFYISCAAFFLVAVISAFTHEVLGKKSVIGENGKPMNTN